MQVAQASSTQSHRMARVWRCKKDTHLYEIATGVLGFIHGTVTQTHQVLLGLSVVGENRDANACRYQQSYTS